MTVVTGILDSVTFTTYHVFTTKQTGVWRRRTSYEESSSDSVSQAIFFSLPSMCSVKKNLRSRSSRQLLYQSARTSINSAEDEHSYPHVFLCPAPSATTNLLLTVSSLAASSSVNSHIESGRGEDHGFSLRHSSRLCWCSS